MKLWQTCKNASAPVGFAVAAFFADSVVAHAGVALLAVGAVCAVATGLYALADARWRDAADGAR